MRTIVFWAAALSLASVCSLSQAGPLTIDDDWTSFDFSSYPDGSGGFEQALVSPFTFTALGPVNVYVTDAYATGDQFAVIVDGVTVGQTNAPAINSPSCHDDFDLCFSDPYTSSGMFTVEAGAHAIDLEILQAFTAGGLAAIRVASATASPIPEPSILLLVGLGLLGLTASRRSQT